jgi:xylulokinase
LEKFQWDEKIANAVFPELIHKLPSLQASTNMSGMISSYFVEKYGFHHKTRCFNWSGDNLCSLVGMGASRPGKWVMSLGTSYTVFCSIEVPRYDPDGFGNVFGNPIEDYMALSCFKNGALACFTLKDQLGIDWIEFDQQAHLLPTIEDSPSLPFYETEITPRHQRVSQCDTTVRSHLDGQFLNMKHHSQWMGDPPSEIFVTGGVSRSKGVCQTIANIFQAEVHRLKNSSSASLGAAMRAAYSSGYTLDELEEKFCQPYDHILPQKEAAPIYEKQMERFIAKLGKD